MKRLSKALQAMAIACCLIIYATVGAAAAANEASTAGVANAAITADAANVAAADEIVLQIVHMNDVNAYVDAAGDTLGYATIAAFIDKIKERSPYTLVLDSGDTLYGRPIATLTEGDAIVAIMNAIGFTAMTPGNHDFGFGYERLGALAEAAAFPILSANVYREDGQRLLQPYVIEDVAGFKVAIFGLTTPDTTFATLPENVRGLVFRDPIAEAQEQVAALREQADLIIALTHLGDKPTEPEAATSRRLAEAVPGIDVIVDAHDGEPLPEGRLVGNTLIVRSAANGTRIGLVELTLDRDGRILRRAATLLGRGQLAEQGVEPDPQIAALIADRNESLAPLLAETIGTATETLDGELTRIRTSETNLGNFVTDVMRARAGADVAFINSGGLRASIPAGAITVGDVLATAPFRNVIQTLSVPGSVIEAALEHGVRELPRPDGRFLQVSGLTYEIDTSAPAGQRVRNVRIGSRPLDPAATYTLAVNDFLATGGDNFAMLAEYPVVAEFGLLDEALIAAIREQGVVAPRVEGRITFAAASAETEEQPAPRAVYIVKRGDTLWAIARRYGTTWPVLQRVNNIKNADLIFPGQQIVIP